MAFPTIAGFGGSNSAANVTQTDVDVAALAGTPNAGDLVIIILCKDGTGTLTWPGTPAFTVIGSEASFGSAAFRSARYRIWQAGDATTVSITHTSEGTSWQVYRITAGTFDSATAPTSQGAGSATGNPDPPSFNPSTWDVEDTLWLAIAYWDGNQSCSYGGTWGTDFRQDRWANTNGVGVASQRRTEAVASTDPDAFTLGSTNCLGQTMAIRPTTGPRHLTLTAASGTFTATGATALMYHDRRLSAASGTFAYTGDDSTALLDRKLGPVAGTFSIVGQAVSLIHSSNAQNMVSLAATEAADVVAIAAGVKLVLSFAVIDALDVAAITASPVTTLSFALTEVAPDVAAFTAGATITLSFALTELADYALFREHPGRGPHKTGSSTVRGANRSSVRSLSLPSASTSSPAAGPDYASELAHYWQMEETTGTRADVVGSINLSDIHTVTSAAGKAGQAASFARASLERLTNATTPPSGSFTVSAWVTLSATGSGTWSIFSFGGTRRPCYLYVSNATNVLCLVEGASESKYALRSGTTVNDGSQHHIVGTYDASTGAINVYVDGAAGTPATLIQAQASPVLYVVGNSVDADSPNAHWNGLIDELAFWAGRVLTPTEVTGLYNSGTGLFYPF